MYEFLPSVAECFDVSILGSFDFIIIMCCGKVNMADKLAPTPLFT